MDNVVVTKEFVKWELEKVNSRITNLRGILDNSPNTFEEQYSRNLLLKLDTEREFWTRFDQAMCEHTFITAKEGLFEYEVCTECGYDTKDKSVECDLAISNVCQTCETCRHLVTEHDDPNVLNTNLKCDLLPNQIIPITDIRTWVTHMVGCKFWEGKELLKWKA